MRRITLVKNRSENREINYLINYRIILSTYLSNYITLSPSPTCRQAGLLYRTSPVRCHHNQKEYNDKNGKKLHHRSFVEFFYNVLLGNTDKAVESGR